MNLTSVGLSVCLSGHKKRKKERRSIWFNWHLVFLPPNTPRRTLSQFLSIKIQRKKTLLNYLKFADLLILRLEKWRKGRSGHTTKRIFPTLASTAAGTNNKTVEQHLRPVCKADEQTSLPQLVAVCWLVSQIAAGTAGKLAENGIIASSYTRYT